ncbi:MAG: SPOR domain-containing protein, partial [Sedimenticola sp.]
RWMNTEDKTEETDAMEPAAGHGNDPYFSLPELEQRLDLLFHLAENSDRVPLLKAEEGMGKTMMLDQLEQRAQPNWHLCRILADAMLQPEQLIDRIGWCVQVQKVGNGDALMRRLEDLRNEGGRVIVAVDDAHQLPVSSIITLLRLSEKRSNGEPLVKVMLFARTDIDEHLATPQIQAMNPQALQMLDLPRYERSQGQAFVQHLLAVHGVDDSLVVLNEQKVERLLKQSEGVPAAIEEGVTRLLAQADLGDGASRGVGIPLLADLSGPAMVGTGLVLALVLITLLFQEQINSLFDGEEELRQASQELTAPPETVVPLELPKPTRPGAVPGVSVPVVASREVSEAEPAQPPEEAADSVSAERGPETVPEEGGTPAQQPSMAAQEEPAPVAEKVEDAKPAKPAKPAEPRATEVVSAEMPVAAPVEDKLQPVNAPKKEAAQEVAKAPQPVKVEPARQVPAKVKEVSLSDEAWLLQQKPTDYTLQLVGLGSEASARKFIKDHGIKGKARVFESSLKGRPWYSVVYGVYGGRSAAVSGREKLPPGIRKTGVWPRSYASIQELIRRR